MLWGLFDPSELAVGSLYKVLGIESFTQSLCLKAIPGIYSCNFFGWGDDPGGQGIYVLKVSYFDYPFALDFKVGGWQLAVGGFVARIVDRGSWIDNDTRSATHK